MLRLTRFARISVRSAHSERDMLKWIRSGSAIRSPIFMRGFSALHGSWKTICISLRNGRIVFAGKFVISRPSKFICPSEGSVRRKIVRPIVDLPDPLSPTIPNTSPRRMHKSTPLTAFTKLPDRPVGNRLVRLVAERTTSVTNFAPGFVV